VRAKPAMRPLSLSLSFFLSSLSLSLFLSPELTHASRLSSHEDLLEEHAITLAIQAAHLAAEWQRLGHHPDGSADLSLLAMGGLIGGRRGSGARILSGRSVSESEDDSGGRAGGGSGTRRLLGTLMMLHAAWCLVHLGLETVVPLWIFTPPERGGLGFEPVDAALVFGFVGCVLLMLKSFTPRRLADLPLHAPLRAMRVGVGILLVLVLCARWVPAAELHKPRNESVRVWVLVTALLSGLSCAIILGRSATSVMLQERLNSIVVLQVLTPRP